MGKCSLRIQCSSRMQPSPEPAETAALDHSSQVIPAATAEMAGWVRVRAVAQFTAADLSRSNSLGFSRTPQQAEMAEVETLARKQTPHHTFRFRRIPGQVQLAVMH